MIPLEKVAETMANIDLGVVPKRNSSFGGEAFSTKILEFMAMGVPVVASRTRIDEYYFDNSIVQFFEPESARDLADKIYHLMRQSERRAELRDASAKLIAAINWDVKKEEYLGLVDHLVA
jgi:glycosyltransferase involved in cell wall biosynthesis